MMITVQPHHVMPAALALVDTIIAIGEAPQETLSHFSAVLGQQPPTLAVRSLEQGEAIIWSRRDGAEPLWIRAVPPRAERQRHVRKYAEGEIGLDSSFYFRGPEAQLNLRAQNLIVFLQIAAGVDDATWLYHLHEGDYARWFRDVIKDVGLAEETAQIGTRQDVSAEESRAHVRAAIEKRYTAPV
jgi:hypothetical protein